MWQLVKLANLKDKNKCWLLWLLLLVLIYFLLQIEVYDTYKIVGLYSSAEKEIVVVIPYDKTEFMERNSIMMNDNLCLDIEEIKAGKISMENNIVMQEFYLSVELSSDKVVDLKIMRNKQRIIKKIFKMMKEG